MNKRTAWILGVVVGMGLLLLSWRIATEGAHKQCGKNDFAETTDCP